MSNFRSLGTSDSDSESSNKTRQTRRNCYNQL